MAWKIIQLETECKIVVFLCAKITSPFLSAFLRKNRTTNKKTKISVGLEMTCMVFFGKNPINLIEIIFMQSQKWFRLEGTTEGDLVWLPAQAGSQGHITQDCGFPCASAKEPITSLLKTDICAHNISINVGFPLLYCLLWNLTPLALPPEQQC